MGATFMALKPRPFESPELEAKFQEHFYGDGLAQMVFAITLMGIGVVLIYLQYGISDFEGTGWFEANQLQRFYRIVVIAAFLAVTLAFWNFWLKHWAYLAIVFVLVVYSVGILLLKVKMASTGLPMTDAGGWRSVTTQISLILLTFPFIRIRLSFLLIVASTSTIALLYFAFNDPTQTVLAGTGLLSAIISGAAIWFNNYRRERDIFDRSIALEEAVEASRISEARATDLANRQRQLARAVTHDIRQPMAAVILQMSLLKYQGSQGKTNPDLEPLAFALDALQTQVQEIARDALPNRPAEPVELSAVDIPQLVSMAVQLHEPLARRSGIELRQWVAPRASDAVAMTNPGQITTILQSLLSNAIKFKKTNHPSSGIIVSVSLIQNQVLIRVFDNGVGIASDVMPRTFDEGFSTSSIDDNSNGLGLFNVRRLTSGLPGHQVSVRSRHRLYTCITLALPAAETPSRPPASIPNGAFARALHIAQDQPNDPLENRAVLLVEDDPLVRTALTDLLRSWGAQLTTTASFDEAMDQLSDPSNKFELVVCDYHLGDGDNGLSILHEALQRYQSNIGAILISGEIHIDMTGSEDIPLVPKPIEPEVLLATAQLQLGSRVESP